MHFYFILISSSSSSSCRAGSTDIPDPNKMAGKEARRQLHKNAASNLEQALAATHHKTPIVRPPVTYHENYSS